MRASGQAGHHGDRRNRQDRSNAQRSRRGGRESRRVGSSLRTAGGFGERAAGWWRAWWWRWRSRRSTGGGAGRIPRRRRRRRRSRRRGRRAARAAGHLCRAGRRPGRREAAHGKRRGRGRSAAEVQRRGSRDASGNAHAHLRMDEGARRWRAPRHARSWRSAIPSPRTSSPAARRTRASRADSLNARIARNSAELDRAFTAVNGQRGADRELERTADRGSAQGARLRDRGRAESDRRAQQARELGHPGGVQGGEQGLVAQSETCAGAGHQGRLSGSRRESTRPVSIGRNSVGEGRAQRWRSPASG